MFIMCLIAPLGKLLSAYAFVNKYSNGDPICNTDLITLCNTVLHVLMISTASSLITLLQIKQLAVISFALTSSIKPFGTINTL